MEQLYVTLKAQEECAQAPDGSYLKDERGEFIRIQLTPLGFAARYNPGKETTDKKNEKQRDWAYRHYHWATPEIDGGIVMIKRGEWQRPKDGGQSVWVEHPAEPAKLQPLIFDNELIEGFKITDFATRYSTSNKLIRIADPRGFELEISVANLLEVIENITIVNGVLVGKFKWDFGKNGIGKAKLVKG